MVLFSGPGAPQGNDVANVQAKLQSHGAAGPLMNRMHCGQPGQSPGLSPLTDPNVDVIPATPEDEVLDTSSAFKSGLLASNTTFMAAPPADRPHWQVAMIATQSRQGPRQERGAPITALASPLLPMLSKEEHQVASGMEAQTSTALDWSVLAHLRSGALPVGQITRQTHTQRPLSGGPVSITSNNSHVHMQPTVQTVAAPLPLSPIVVDRGERSRQEAAAARQCQGPAMSLAEKLNRWASSSSGNDSVPILLDLQPVAVRMPAAADQTDDVVAATPSNVGTMHEQQESAPRSNVSTPFDDAVYEAIERAEKQALAARGALPPATACLPSGDTHTVATHVTGGLQPGPGVNTAIVVATDWIAAGPEPQKGSVGAQGGSNAGNHAQKPIKSPPWVVGVTAGSPLHAPWVRTSRQALPQPQLTAVKLSQPYSSKSTPMSDGFMAAVDAVLENIDWGRGGMAGQQQIVVSGPNSVNQVHQQAGRSMLPTEPSGGAGSGGFIVAAPKPSPMPVKQLDFTPLTRGSRPDAPMHVISADQKCASAASGEPKPVMAAAILSGNLPGLPPRIWQPTQSLGVARSWPTVSDTHEAHAAAARFPAPSGLLLGASALNPTGLQHVSSDLDDRQLAVAREPELPPAAIIQTGMPDGHVLPSTLLDTSNRSKNLFSAVDVTVEAVPEGVGAQCELLLPRSLDAAADGVVADVAAEIKPDVALEQQEATCSDSEEDEELPAGLSQPATQARIKMLTRTQDTAAHTSPAPRAPDFEEGLDMDVKVGLGHYFCWLSSRPCCVWHCIPLFAVEE